MGKLDHRACLDWKVFQDLLDWLALMDHKGRRGTKALMVWLGTLETQALRGCQASVE